jgi:dihydrofolate reductase
VLGVSRLVYSMMVSLDGFVARPDGALDWVIVDEELHRFENEQARNSEAFLYGRRLYELMAHDWPPLESDTSIPDYMVEFARIWIAKPKIVFSRTLKTVEWNSRLVSDGVGQEVARLKSRPGGDLDVGGPGLAASLIELGLVDEYRLVVQPVVLAAGVPFFPALSTRINLRLLETRRFQSGVVSLRYEAA